MSTSSHRDRLLAAVDGAGVLLFRRGLLASEPAWHAGDQVGVGVADLASGRTRQVWKLMPSSATDAMDRPMPGRPFLRELSRRAFGAMLRRVGPVEMLWEDGVPLATRGAHDEEWEPGPGHRDDNGSENDPLHLLHELRSGGADLHVTAAPGGLPGLIAVRDDPPGTTETWRVLTLEECPEPFDSVDLSARWDAS